jgi:hypothetical protein
MEYAARKKEENIVEYILYMYQLEDVIRAFNLSLDDLLEHYVLPQLAEDADIEATKKWYSELIQQMKREGISQSGHFSELKDIVMELSYLHNTLINLSKEDQYRKAYHSASGFIDEFKDKTNLKDRNNIEIALHALYMKLLMRLKKTPISPETEEAFEAMRVILALLANAYRRMKMGDLNFLNN